MEDGAEAAVLTDGDVQAGGSGTQGPTAEGRDDPVEKFGSDTDISVDRARLRLMGRRQVRLVSITEEEEDRRDKDSQDESSSPRLAAKKGRGKKGSKEKRERERKRERDAEEEEDSRLRKKYGDS